MSPPPPSEFLIIDLETVAIGGADAYLEPIEPPSNYKDPEKIAAWIADARQKQIARMALDLDLARVVAIGYQRTSLPTVGAMICRTETDEAAFYRMFRDQLEGMRLLTYNGAPFDLPLLVRRFRYLGLAPLQLELDRYRTPHLDLYDHLTLRGRVSAHKLGWYDKRFGHTYPDTIDGSAIAQAATDGRWDAIEAHVMADVRRIYNLARFLGVVGG